MTKKTNRTRLDDPTPSHSKSAPLANNHRLFRLEIEPLQTSDEATDSPCFRGRVLHEGGPKLTLQEGNRWGRALCNELIRVGVAKDIATGFTGFHESSFEFLYIGVDDPEQIGLKRAVRSFLVGQLGHITVG